MFKEMIAFLENTLNISNLKIDEENFIPLESNDSFPINAVDGGSSIFLDGGTWNLSSIKVGYVRYFEGKRTAQEISEYFLIAVQKDEGFVIKLFPESKEFILSARMTPIEEVPNLIRSILEWEKINELLSKAASTEIFLKDGAFAGTELMEKEIINTALKNAKAKNFPLVGICKTSKSNAVNGRPLLGIINQSIPEKLKKMCWLYKDENLTAVKLHPSSIFTYKIDSALSNDELHQYLPTVLAYSKDPELIGYPYPLLKVDKIARVPTFELSRLNNQIKIVGKKLGKEFIESDETTTIMHKLMDKRAYR